MPTLGDSEKKARLSRGAPLAFADLIDGENEQARAERTLQAAWLENLVPYPDRVCAVPVRIKNAVIEGRIEWRFARFRFDVSFVNCRFTHFVDFSCTTFERAAVFDDTWFEKSASLRASHAAYDLNFRGTRFSARNQEETSWADLADLQVDGVLNMNGAWFDLPVRFDRLHVKKNAVFDPRRQGDEFVPARFASDARFRDAHVGENFSLHGAWFGGEANFRRLRVDSTLAFDVPRFADGEVPIKDRALATQFEGRVSFEDTTVGGPLYAQGARFAREASFRGLRVGGEARFNALHINGVTVVTHFEGPAEFGRAQFEDNVDFRGAQFEKETSFWLAKIEGNARFSTAAARDIADRDETVDRSMQAAVTMFHSTVDFAEASIQGTAEFKGTQFRDDALFGGLVIGGRAVFTPFWDRSAPCRTRFGGRTTFVDSHVTGVASFEGVAFEGVAEFNRFRVDSNLYFSGAEAPLDVDYAGRLFPCVFHHDAKFREMRVAGAANCDGGQFLGDAQFVRARIGGDLRMATRRTWNDVTWPCFAQDATFDGAEIEGNAHFDGAQFGGPVSFDDITLGGSLFFRPTTAGGIVLRNHFYRRASFVRVDCGGDLVIVSACFNDECTFEHVHVSGNALVHGGWKPGSRRVWFRRGARFFGARVDGVAEFLGARFDDVAVFNQFRATGAASFQRSVFKRNVSFVGAKLNTLLFSDPAGSSPRRFVPTRFQGTVDLRDCVYERISVGWRDLLARTKPFDRQPYNQMEQFFRLSGQDRDAGNVYHARRRREVNERVRLVFKGNRGRRLSSWGRLREIPQLAFDVAQWGLFRFGVRPFRLAVFSVAIWLLGALVFEQRGAVSHAEQKTSKQLAELEESQRNLPAERHAQIERALRIARRDFSVEPLNRGESLWYSARLFVPLVDLPAGGPWVPTNENIGFVRMTAAQYASLHRIAGYLLVPLAVAALTGLLHRRNKM